MVTPLGPLFLFFLLFFFRFLSFHLVFIFSFFVHFFIFRFFNVFHFVIFSREKVSSFLFSCTCFKYFYCWHKYQSLTVDVSSVVGAPWRCGVLTT